MPVHETGISGYASELLARPTVGQVRFSDVYPETAGLDEPMWWRKTDFDASLTDRVESGGFSGVERIPIGLRPWMTPYGLLLTDDLVLARNGRIDALVAEGGAILDHPDVQKEIEERSGAVVALGNKAHRDRANTEGGKNGSNFYVAITESGTEYYVTPLDFLGDLEAQDRITALYEVPNEEHPEFNGDEEQFRSARVNRTRRHPEHVARIFDYEGDLEALQHAKHEGTHPSVIPVDPRSGRFAHVDKFGNLLGWVKDRSVLSASRIGGLATLAINSPGWAETAEIEVVIAKNLKSAPLDELAVYANCSTQEDAGVSGGLFEVVARVDDDPNVSENTAFFQVLRFIRERGLPDLDIAAAEISLREGGIA